MSGPINISSTGEWQSILSGANVVVADFYADWCGPCKMIAPHFERLAKEYTRPKKVAFVKVNVDSQSSISRSEGVSAMPTFKIYHGGRCIETVKGANPPVLAEAISKAVKLGDAGKPGDSFKSPGRTLGGEGGSSSSGGRRVGGRAASSSGIMNWDLNNLINSIVILVGLYFVSLFTIDSYESAKQSHYNIHAPPRPRADGRNGSSGGPNGAGRAAQKPAFRTLADLGDE